MLAFHIVLELNAHDLDRVRDMRDAFICAECIKNNDLSVMSVKG